MMLQWASIAPFGLPVVARGVEDHRDVLFINVACLFQRRQIRKNGKVRKRNIVVNSDPMFQIRHITGIGQPIGQRRLEKQKLRATIGQHIGDFRFLLSRR
jgi:hypothetical protein